MVSQSSNTTNTSNEPVRVEEPPEPFTHQQYKNIESFEDAVNLVKSTLGGETVARSQDLGDGFTLLSTEDKDKLVGQPFLILHYRFVSSDKVPNARYATCRVVTQQGNKYILNDGSTGICQQLINLDNDGHDGPVWAARGLRKSTYQNEHTTEGVTYYLDTSDPDQ